MKIIVTDPDSKRYDLTSIVKDNIQLSSSIDNITAQMEFELAYNYTRLIWMKELILWNFMTIWKL